MLLFGIGHCIFQKQFFIKRPGFESWELFFEKQWVKHFFKSGTLSQQWEQFHFQTHCRGGGPGPGGIWGALTDHHISRPDGCPGHLGLGPAPGRKRAFYFPLLSVCNEFAARSAAHPYVWLLQRIPSAQRRGFLKGHR